MSELEKARSDICRDCDEQTQRCSAYHPEYGFTCLIPAPVHGPVHFDAAGGYWTEDGQVNIELAAAGCWTDDGQIGLDRARPLHNIAAERTRQDAKFGARRDYPDGTGGDGAREVADFLRAVCKAAPADGDKWSDILAEEVAEAFAETNPATLRRELVQVAAVAVAWIEGIDRRPTPTRDPTQTEETR